MQNTNRDPITNSFPLQKASNAYGTTEMSELYTSDLHIFTHFCILEMHNINKLKVKVMIVTSGND